MWKNNGNGVNKMFKRELKERTVLDSLQCFMIYPQVNYKWEDKIWLTRSLKLAIHIPTSLIVIINFYI